MQLKYRFADLGLTGMNLVHRVLLGVSGGRIGRSVFGLKTVELHVIGRRSGKWRSTLLSAPIYEPGSRVVLVASKGGDDRNPEWYRNLTVNPEIDLTIDGDTTRWTARTASADEKGELWPLVVKAYSGYAGYQKRTDRDIPLIICVPAD